MASCTARVLTTVAHKIRRWIVSCSYSHLQALIRLSYSDRAVTAIFLIVSDCSIRVYRFLLGVFGAALLQEFSCDVARKCVNFKKLFQKITLLFWNYS